MQGPEFFWDLSEMIAILVVFLSLVLFALFYAGVIYKRRQALSGKPMRRFIRPEESKDSNEAAQGKVEAQRQSKELQQASEEERKTEDEAQSKEEQRQKADEEDRRGEEERKSFEEEKTQKAERVPPKVETERGRVEPGKRGGRPRASTKAQEKPAAQKTKSRRPKPEIICWKKERQWIPAVEIPEEFLEKSGLTVLQDSLPLTQEESKEARWRLERLFGEVVVRWNESEGVQETRTALGQDGYLIFKLSGQDQNQGRRVKTLSSGSYLVMVPDNWEREDTLSGPPPVTPEPVFLTGYQAHFFELEKDVDGKIAFRTPTDEPFVIESKAPEFELVGNRLCDATEKIVPLFGERPPQIRAPDDQTWKDVGTIVVGEEGSGKGKWRMQFSPDPNRTLQDLPSEVADRKGGWYFLRFYDTNDDLMESLDFRFICALKEIKILQPSPIPPQGGHSPVSVQFLHEPGCIVQPIDGLTNIQIERQDDKTILTIPPDPTYDETRWLVGPKGGPHVEVTLLVERLWWGVGGENDAPSEWKDRLLTLSRDDFAATSTKAFWLRLPRRCWTDEVLVGFERSRGDRCSIQVTSREAAKALRDFVTFKEIADREHKHLLKVWIKHDNGHDEGLVEGVVAIIPAEQPTRVKKGERPLLNLDMISAPRLATVLTCLRRKTAGPLRVLVKKVRKKYDRERTARQVESLEFKSYALCVIALTLELTPQILGLKKRWVVRAQLARDEIPEIMNRIRNRYRQISTSRAYRAGIEGEQNEPNGNGA